VDANMGAPRETKVDAMELDAKEDTK